MPLHPPLPLLPLLTHVCLQAGVVITTFTMVAFSGKRSEESEKVMQMIQSREWGLLLMDEVHVVPAQVCRVWKVWRVWIEKV